MHARPRFRTRAAAALGLLLAVAFAAPTSHAATTTDPRNSAPLELVITVQTAPHQRLALRDAMETSGLQAYEQMKREGILADYRVLFSRFVDSENWDLMTVLTFKDQAAAQRWKDIERRTPAGLPAAALALANKVSTSPTDLIRSGKSSTPAKPGESVFVVLPYDYMVSTDAYIQYINDYLIPQTDGWLQEGLLASYDMSIARYGSARFWASQLVLEYRNDAALGDRDAVMAKVRAKLAATNPTWKSISQSKSNVRVGRQYIIADQLIAR